MADRTNAPTVIPVRTFRADDLHQLLTIHEWPSVSIHLPTSRRYPDSRQDPIKFKTLLAQAETEIAARAEDRASQGILDPLRRMLDDEELWEHSLDGLAVFSSPSFTAAYRVPMAIPEAVVVTDTFHTKPLFRFLRTNSRYYVLTLSQNSVGLYQGSSYGAEPVNLRALPADLSSALGASELDEGERSVVVHGGAGAGRSFHGRGPGKEDRKETLVKFFRAIDKGLHDYLKAEKVPLLLAAVRYYHPIYREANTYPHLLPEGLDGNYERSIGEDLHKEAWPIVSREVDRRIGEWVERYRSLEGKGLAVSGVREVASATVQGRVWCVLASEDGGVWGRLDRATGEVDQRDAPTGRDDADLLDDICEEAWKRGADVYVLPKGSLPNESPIAAVLRF